jgi:drug/metabolite transporter (DMT)-like permease
MLPSRHLRAVLEALLVTFLWSTSWVLIKVGLREIPALTFAGLRYALASLVLAPILWSRRREIRALGWRGAASLIPLGLVMYTATQGGQFLTLVHLDAVTFSLILSFTPVFVAGAGLVFLEERPGRLQWIGLACIIGGALLYFRPTTIARGSPLGFGLAAATLAANVAASLLGRSVNRRAASSPLVVTGISMAIGSILLLALGAGTQGLPALSLRGWGISLWLAVVNTAVAFTLWNRSLRTLSAAESSVVNNTMLVQIALLAWLFLGERLGGMQIVGLLIVTAGTLTVQLGRRETPNHVVRPSPRI